MFDIFKAGEADKHWVESTPTLEAAKERVHALGEFWPGEYLVCDRDSGDWLTITIDPPS